MWCTKLQMQLHLSYQWPPSPSSLCIFVWTSPHPAPPLLTNVTRSFLRSVCLRLSFLHHSSLHRFLCFIKHSTRWPGPLTPWQRRAHWRQAGCAASANQDVLKQPLSGRGREGHRCWQRREEEKRITSFPIPTRGGDQTSTRGASIRCSSLIIDYFYLKLKPDRKSAQSVLAVGLSRNIIYTPSTHQFIHPFIHPSTNSSIHPTPHPWQANTA